MGAMRAVMFLDDRAHARCGRQRRAVTTMQKR